MSLPAPAAPTAASLRWFGLLVLVFFGLIGGLVLWQFEALRVSRVLWSIGAVFALVYYAVPPLRLPMYNGWILLFSPIGWLVSHALLGAIYFGLITPIGLALRAFGRDRMGRGFEASAKSYWVEHDDAPEPARYFRQS